MTRAGRIQPVLCDSWCVLCEHLESAMQTLCTVSLWKVAGDGLEDGYRIARHSWVSPALQEEHGRGPEMRKKARQQEPHYFGHKAYEQKNEK